MNILFFQMKQCSWNIMEQTTFFKAADSCHGYGSTTTIATHNPGATTTATWIVRSEKRWQWW